MAVVLLSAWSAPALAETTDEARAGARAAAYAGVEAFEAGRWSEAVDYFTRAESIIHSPMHLAYIGRARAQLGELVSARETLLKVLREEAHNDVAREAQAAARAELEALEPRLPMLTIQVQGAEDQAFEVSVDGKSLPPALVGIPTPTDPGERTILVTSTNARAERTVRLAEGARETVVLELRPTSEGAEAGSVEVVSVSPLTSDTSGISGLRVGSYVALGVGVVGLGAGTFFALRANSKNDDASRLCEDHTGTRSCAGLPSNDPLARRVAALDDDSSQARTISTIGFIAGGVGVAAGVTLFVLSLNESKEQPVARRVTPVLAHNYVGLSGTF
ncbi:MAG: hypothetical protein GX607_12895 [Myxococcales bacterium]|nr:hypothetical protein [Myxococcales bacterium]